MKNAPKPGVVVANVVVNVAEVEKYAVGLAVVVV
jgi:hypothetical protein